jgi:hypothetical protein
VSQDGRAPARPFNAVPLFGQGVLMPPNIITRESSRIECTSILRWDHVSTNDGN